MSKLDLSQPDWVERMRCGESPVDLQRIKPHLNQKRMKRIREILNGFCIPDLPGQPTMKEKTGEWFFDIAEVCAGGLVSMDEQLIKTCLVTIPKKNAKTSSAAALMLGLLMMSPRPNSESLILGPTIELANISFRQASGIIRASKELSAQFKIRDHVKRIEHIPSGNVLAIRSFDPAVVTGAKNVTVLIEEAHLLTQEYAGRVYGQLVGAGAAISELQIIIITTMSDKPSAGWWRTELKKAREIRDGESDIEGYLPIIYEPSPEEQKDIKLLCQPEVWARCNPNIGRSVNLGWLKSNFKEALAVGEDEVHRWLSQHTNAEVGSFAMDSNNWAGAAVWNRGAKPDLTLEWILENCNQVAIGVDFGGASDLSSAAILGKLNDVFYCVTRSWVEPTALDYHKSIAAMLQDFEEMEDLKIADAGTDVDDIVELCRPLLDDLRLAGVGVDPNGVASELGERLENDIGMMPHLLVAVGQGYKLRSGYLTIERALKQGRFFHADQPILNWAVSNALQDKSSGLVTKKLSGAGKIDPIVACATAMMVMNEAPEPLPDDVSFMIG